MDKFIKTILIGIVLIVGSVAVYQILLNLVKITLERYGILNPLYQYSIILVFVIIILGLLGVGFKSSLKKLVGK